MFFFILKDDRTQSFYMDPYKFYFYAYSDESKINNLPPHAQLVQTDAETQKELTTMLFNAGFVAGYLDGELLILTNNDSYYYNPNKNEIAYAQYLLTKDTTYLENLIEKDHLVSICKIDGQSILFPTIQTEDGDTVVLTYTDLRRIPSSLLKKYEGYRPVRMTFDVKCIVNNKFIIC